MIEIIAYGKSFEMSEPLDIGYICDNDPIIMDELQSILYISPEDWTLCKIVIFDGGHRDMCYIVLKKACEDCNAVFVGAFDLNGFFTLSVEGDLDVFCKQMRV